MPAHVTIPFLILFREILCGIFEAFCAKVLDILFKYCSHKCLIISRDIPQDPAHGGPGEALRSADERR